MCQNTIHICISWYSKICWFLVKKCWCITWFKYFLDLFKIRRNCVKFHHCRICNRFWGMFMCPPSMTNPEKAHSVEDWFSILGLQFWKAIIVFQISTFEFVKMQGFLWNKKKVIILAPKMPNLGIFQQKLEIFIIILETSLPEFVNKMENFVQI